MAIIDEMQDLFDRWLDAFANGDVETCLTCYTANGEIHSSDGLPASGTSELRQTHLDWMAEGGRNKTISVADARAGGGMAYAVARYDEDFPDGSGSWTRTGGTSVNVAMRQTDGTWKLHLTALCGDSAD